MVSQPQDGAHPAITQVHCGTERGALLRGTWLKPGPGRGMQAGDHSFLCTRTLKFQPCIITACELSRPHFRFFSALSPHLVFNAEKCLSPEPGPPPYNIRDDSVPEHKVALLKA